MLGSVEMSNISKKEVKKFLINHPDDDVSSAKLMYSYFLCDSIADSLYDLTGISDEEKQVLKLIEMAKTPEELIKVMRTSIISMPAREKLRKKLLDNETEVLPLIKQRCMKNKQDEFIEIVAEFFCYCKENCREWILENYKEVSSEYMKSMLCLVIGFRGQVEDIPFLMEEAKRFLKYYPEESFDQAPALAVQELAVKYLNW